MSATSFAIRARVTALCLALGLYAGAPPATAGELSALEPGPLLQLVLPDLEGRPFDLADHQGKVVLVNFWASWCTPCIEEMPSIERLADGMQGRPFVVVTVNVGEGELRAKAMVERLGLGLPVLLDKDSAVFERWRATVLPTTYLLDAAGVPRYVGRGPLEWDGVEASALVDRLLDESAAPAGAETEPPSAGGS